MNLELTIDAEFKPLIAPLTPQEFDLLKEQILAQGCLEPLIVWKTEDDRRILVDGHNRYQICRDNKRDYSTRNIPLASREHAKLWILQHQAGRRNLTDDQRAIIWNEIREQQSKIVQAEKLQKARDAKAGVLSISAKITEIEHQKKDTRKEIAQNAHLSESKLKRAQKLKRYHPELYEKVLSGELTLRDVATELPKKTEARKDQDYFCRVGRKLDGLFKGKLKEMLDDLCRLKQKDMTSTTEKSLQQIIVFLKDVSDHSDGYAIKFKTILRSNKNTKAKAA